MTNAEINEHISHFYNPRVDKVELVGYLYYNNSEYQNIQKINKKIPSTFKGIFHLSYLKKKSYQDVFRKGFTLKDRFVDNLGILLFIFENHKNTINDFIKKQQDFECHFLNGEYDKAKDVIEYINKHISYSLWAAKCEIKLARLNDGIGSSVKKYNSLITQNSHIFFNYFCQNALKTSEIEFSLDAFINSYHTQFQQFDDDNFRDFFISHCCPFKEYGINSIKEEFYSSIIDLYLAFQARLNLLTIDEIETNDSIRDCLLKINNTITDPYLNKYCILWGISSQYNYPNFLERSNLSDLYYSERYDEVVALSTDYLKKMPFDITILDIYVKSVLKTDGEIVEADKSSSLLSKITYYYYCYFKKDKSSNIFLKKLYTICNAEYMILGLRHLYNILKSYETKKTTKMLEDFWRYSYAINLRDIACFNSLKKKENFLKSIPYPIVREKYMSLFKDYKEVHKNIGFEILELQILGDTAISTSLIQSLEERIIQNSIPSYMKDKIASFLFSYYIENQNAHKAINFFVDEKLKDDELFNTLDITEEITHNIENKELEFQIPLELSIFHTIIGSDTYKRYLLYKRYIKSIRRSRASDITIDNSNDLKLKYFLSHVVDLKVLGLHVLLFKNSNEVMEERLSICNNLYNEYNEKIYFDEIEQLIKEQTIKGLIKKVDESKIFVDEESLVKNDLDEEIKIFEIYKNTQLNTQYAQIDGVSEILDALRSVGMNVQLYTTSEDMISQQKMVDYKYSLFHQLYMNIRDKFLTNPKSGLDYYLSTRIRHGTLVNQLRHHFQKYRLITNIGDNESYMMDSYWSKDVLLLKGEKQNMCSETFLQFTKTIDKLILTMKDEYVQIKTESFNKEKQACFDYNIELMDYEIHNLFQEIKTINNFEDFVSRVIQNLWIYTECCLDIVKGKLENLRQDFLDALNSLEKEITEIIDSDNTNISKLIEAIGQCRTAIQSDINTVSNWFQRKYTVGFDFTIQMAIETSIAFINKINPTHLMPIEDINSETILKGEYFNSFNDLFNDLFNNILGYSKKRKLDTKFTVNVSELNDTIQIEIRNPIKEEDIALTQKMIEEVRGKYDTLISKGISRGEGNSGIAKIYNVVMNILGDENNQYEMNISDGEFISKITLNITQLKA